MKQFLFSIIFLMTISLCSAILYVQNKNDNTKKSSRISKNIPLIKAYDVSVTFLDDQGELESSMTLDSMEGTENYWHISKPKLLHHKNQWEVRGDTGVAYIKKRNSHVLIKDNIQVNLKDTWHVSADKIDIAPNGNLSLTGDILATKETPTDKYRINTNVLLYDASNNILHNAEKTTIVHNDQTINSAQGFSILLTQ